MAAGWTRALGALAWVMLSAGCNDGSGGDPTGEPSQTAQPTVVTDPSPTATSGSPTLERTPEPTEEPTPAPTEQLTPEPTEQLTPEPTEQLTPAPTEEPTSAPTEEPTPAPTSAPPTPGPSPTAEPTSGPSPSTTDAPTSPPTDPPTAQPTPAPTATDAPDRDGDGVPAGQDCDDEEPGAYPGNSEGCDELDNDCDGDVDENVAAAPLWYADADEDGYGADDYTTRACAAPEGYVAAAGDCDDGDPSFNPGAPEPNCGDPNDYNCDGSTGYADEDGDGFPACEECDDTREDIHPDAAELCDGIDNDCDDLIDDEDNDVAGAPSWYADLDEDSYGDPGGEIAACEQPSGTVTNDEDCDDSDSAINPETTWYGDYDRDGHGGDVFTVTACVPPRGFVSSNDDCDDSDPLFYPGAPEDNCGDPNDYNCDGSVAYVDADGDGFGACEECDDTSSAVSPSAVETCNGVDDDCDGAVDEGVTQTYFDDDDGDGYGDPSDTTTACAPPPGYVLVGGDCNDTTGAVRPGAQELPNGADDDCDGAVDDNAVYASCKAIHAAQPGLGSGSYVIDPDGSGSGPSFTVYCDMVVDGGGWTRFWWLRENLSSAGDDPFGQELSACSASGARCFGRIPAGVTPTDLMVKDVAEGHHALWRFASNNAISNAVLSAMRDHATACLINTGTLWQPYAHNDNTGEGWCGNGGEGGCDSFHYQFNNTCTTYRTGTGWTTELDGDGGCYAGAWKVGVGQPGYPECSTPDQNFLDDGPSNADDMYGEMYYR